MKSNAKEVLQSLCWFAIVGFSAMGVHFLAVTQLFIPLGLPPLIANTGGFLIAFIVSFFGHHHFTFRSEKALGVRPMLQSAQRFFIVAITSFLLNQVIFYLLLKYSTLSLDVALAITLIVVAIATYITSKLWAFKH